MPELRRRGTPHSVTIITHRRDCAQLAWIRFLLGERAGEVIEDPDRRLVQSNSLIVCDRLDRLRHKTLAAVRRAGSVGLFHLADKRYRCRLDPYLSFGWVWRIYFHTGLADEDRVRQFPLGPTLLADLQVDPWPPAQRTPAERLYTWCFIGEPSESDQQMLDAFAEVDGGAQRGSLDPGTTLDIVRESVFAPCPADDGHLESSRIYDALEMGTIPIVERRRWLDYFHELFGSHPLPTVESWSEAPALVARLLADQDALVSLQQEIVRWWASTKRSLALAAQEDVARCLDPLLGGSEHNGTPLGRPAPRWRGHIEALRHRH